MPRKPPTTIKINDYYTDGTQLVMVVGFLDSDASVIVEDVVTEVEFVVKPNQFSKWRSVEVAHAA